MVGHHLDGAKNPNAIHGRKNLPHHPDAGLKIFLDLEFDVKETFGGRNDLDHPAGNGISTVLGLADLFQREKGEIGNPGGVDGLEVALGFRQ